MSRVTVLYLVSAGIFLAVIAVIVVASRLGDGGLSELRALPVLEVRPPDSELLDRTDTKGILGGRASVTLAYGTYADAAAICAVYDPALSEAGFERDEADDGAEREGGRVLRTYRRGRTSVELLLAGLPRKVGSRWRRGPWPSALYVTLRA